MDFISELEIQNYDLNTSIKALVEDVSDMLI